MAEQNEVRITIRLDKGLAVALRRAAKTRYIDVAKVIRHAVRFWFAHGSPAELPLPVIDRKSREQEIGNRE